MAGPSIINLNDTTPVAPSGRLNVKYQGDASTPIRNVSSHIPNIGGVDPRTTTTETIGLASQGMLVTLSNASAIAATLDSSAGAGYFSWVEAIGVGAATLTPNGSKTINGSANLSLPAGASCMLFIDGTGNWRSALFAQSVTNPYDIAIPLAGRMDAASTTYLVMTFTRAVTLPANLSGSKGTVLTNPSSTTTYTLNKNGTSCGTVAVSTSGVFSFTTAGSAAVNFAIGDYLTITAPVADATLADFEVTLAGTR